MTKENILHYLKDKKDNFKNRYNIIKIGIFGSYAKDRANSNSDIDIVVEFDKFDAFNLIGIKQDIEKDLKKRVDIVQLREKMNNFLKNRIEQEAIYV